MGGAHASSRLPESVITDDVRYVNIFLKCLTEENESRMSVACNQSCSQVHPQAS